MSLRGTSRPLTNTSIAPGFAAVNRSIAPV
jgi:hypothetical protein